jgi:hypothetical protein
MPQKKFDKSANYEPLDTDKLLDFLPIDKDWPLDPTEIMLKFKNKMDEIYTAGQKQGLCVGEIHAMININFGYWKRDMPWGKIDEVKQWIINNAFRSFQILNPTSHTALMQTDNPYSQDFKLCEKSISAKQPRSEW